MGRIWHEGMTERKDVVHRRTGTKLIMGKGARRRMASFCVCGHGLALWSVLKIMSTLCITG